MPESKLAHTISHAEIQSDLCKRATLQSQTVKDEMHLNSGWTHHVSCWDTTSDFASEPHFAESKTRYSSSQVEITASSVAESKPRTRTSLKDKPFFHYLGTMEMVSLNFGQDDKQCQPNHNVLSSLIWWQCVSIMTVSLMTIVCNGGRSTFTYL